MWHFITKTIYKLIKTQLIFRVAKPDDTSRENLLDDITPQTNLHCTIPTY